MGPIQGRSICSCIVVRQRNRENLVRAMIVGRKRALDAADVA
jgi:cytochrome b